MNYSTSAPSIFTVYFPTAQKYFKGGAQPQISLYFILTAYLSLSLAMAKKKKKDDGKKAKLVGLAHSVSSNLST